MKYLVGPLGLYIIFLVSFSALTQFHLSNDHYTINFPTIFYSFYYNGAYLLLIKLMQMAKHKSNCLKLLYNILELCSIILGMIVFTLVSLMGTFDIAIGISRQTIIILTTITISILWFELVCLMVFMVF